MIYTVTLNPALDRFIVVEQVLTEDTTRILSDTAYAAGKGINVSRGRKGLLLSLVKQKIKAIAPPVEVDSTVGAGDSVVGGFVLAHSRGKDLADCVRLACAAGTATAQTPGTELCHRAGVEAILPRVELSFL